VKTVLFGWELGANLGHVAPMARIIRELPDDIRPVFAVRDLGAARLVLQEFDVPVLQAPVWPHHSHMGQDESDASYVDILVRMGFADPHKLAAVVAGWQALLDYVKPDLVVTDHAPGLQAAISNTGRKTLAIGTGYTMPPLGHKRFPPLRGDRAPLLPEPRMVAVLEQVLGPRVSVGHHPLLDLFRTDGRVVYALPELDPYLGARREPLCLPPEALPQWVEPPRDPHLFVYLGAEQHKLDLIVQGLASSRFSVSAYLRGGGGALGEFLKLRGHRVFDERPDLSALLPEVTHVLHAGGAFTSQAALSAGRPQLVVPMHPEAETNLLHLSRLGVASGLDMWGEAADFERRIENFLIDHNKIRQAQNVAGTIGAREQPSGLRATLKAIESLLA